MTKPVNKSAQRAFTLIELLVVIAIIAVLMAVVMPALNNAKLIARQTVCASQMKQWGLAVTAYITENNNTIPLYGEVSDMTNYGNALDPETWWYNRLTPYLTSEYYGQWGMRKVRKCPMGRENWGENAVWIGVYYGGHKPENAPFIFPAQWTGTELIQKCSPVKYSSIKSPAYYLMLLDTGRDVVFEPIHWKWDIDYDGDGKKDSRGSVAADKGPYNFAQPKIHRGGCNIVLFDGHVEWIRYDTFWQIGNDGYPVHPYWYNQNRP